jgi:hypothetical protein
MEEKTVDLPTFHNTCTSTPLEGHNGSTRESINTDVLNKLYKKQTGTTISDDPVVARIQREQALVRDKRLKKDR